MKFLQLEIETPPTVPVVTPEEFIDHARLNGITVQKQPELIARELSAATARCENWCRRSFISQGIKARYVSDGRDCSCAGLLILPRGKVLSVETVAVGGAALPAEGWTFDGWNVVKLTTPATTPVIVNWTSGYGATAADVPAGVKEGVLEYATTLYDDRRGAREIKATADQGSGVPIGVADILRQFQIEISG